MSPNVLQISAMIDHLSLGGGPWEIQDVCRLICCMSIKHLKRLDLREDSMLQCSSECGSHSLVIRVDELWVNIPLNISKINIVAELLSRLDVEILQFFNINEVFETCNCTPPLKVSYLYTFEGITLNDVLLCETLKSGKTSQQVSET